MSNWIYVGAFDKDGDLNVPVPTICVIEDGKNPRALAPRTDLKDLVPHGFAWGRACSGAAQSALSILADHLGDDTKALEYHILFMWDSLVPIPANRGFVITASEIDARIETLKSVVRTGIDEEVSA